MPLTAKVDADLVTPEVWTPIPLDYDEKEMADFADYIARRISASNDSRRGSGFEDMVRTRRDEFECQRRSTQGPWPGSVNLRLPTAYSIVTTIHAHIYKTLVVQPFFIGIPAFDGAIPRAKTGELLPQGLNVPPEVAEQIQAEVDARMEMEREKLLTGANKKQLALDYTLRYQMRFADILRTTLRASMVDGGRVLEIGMGRKVEKKRRFDIVTPELRRELHEKYDQTYPDLAAQADSYEDGQGMVLTDYEVTLDRPVCESVDILEFNTYPVDPPIGPPEDQMKHVQAAWRRVWLSEGDLTAGVATGEFDKEVVAQMLEHPGLSPGFHSLDAGGDRPRHQSAGFNQDTEVSDDDKPYETYRGVIRHDCDGDGFIELVLFHIYLDGDGPMLLRCEVFPYFHDHFPFIMASVHERDGFLYPYSLVELGKELSKEINAIRNQRVDNGTLRNMPTFLQRDSCKWQPEKTPFQPGTIIRVSDVDKDLKLIDFGIVDQSSFAEEDRAVANWREMAGVNDTMVQAGAGKEKTATELERSLQSVNVKFDVLLDACRLWMDEAAFQIVSLLAQYAPDEQRVFTGFEKNKAVFADVTREDMQTRMGFQARGTSALANPVLKAQRAEKLAMFSERSEFVQYNAAHRYQVAAEVVGTLTENGDYEAYIGSLDEFIKFMAGQPAPQPEVKVSESRKVDEIATLALLLSRGEPLTPELYLAAAELAAQARSLLPVPPKGAEVGDATDNPAGY